MASSQVQQDSSQEPNNSSNLPSQPYFHNDQNQITSSKSKGSPQTFLFGKSGDATTVRLRDAPANSPPLFSFSTSNKNLNLFQGEAAAKKKIGTATLHSLSRKTDLTYDGRATSMKTSSMSGNHTFDTPRLGRLKWTMSQSGSSRLELKDGKGKMLARYGSEKFMGDKVLQIFIPFDEHFLGLVLLSAMACNVVANHKAKVDLGVQILDLLS